MTGLARVNLTLAALVTLLALVALFGPDPAGERTLETLTPLNPEKLERIRIHRSGDEPISFEHRADGWQMTAPFRLTADQKKLAALAHIAAAPSHRSFPAGETDLSELGLAPAPLRLELDGLTLEIGGTEPIGRHRYVRLGDRVHLIDDRFQHHLLAPAETLLESSPEAASPGN